MPWTTAASTCQRSRCQLPITATYRSRTVCLIISRLSSERYRETMKTLPHRAVFSSSSRLSQCGVLPTSGQTWMVTSSTDFVCIACDCRYSQTQIAGIGTACNVGGYFALFAGLLLRQSSSTIIGTHLLLQSRMTRRCTTSTGGDMRMQSG